MRMSLSCRVPHCRAVAAGSVLGTNLSGRQHLGGSWFLLIDGEESYNDVSVRKIQRGKAVGDDTKVSSQSHPYLYGVLTTDIS